MSCDILFGAGGERQAALLKTKRKQHRLKRKTRLKMNYFPELSADIIKMMKK